MPVKVFYTPLGHRGSARQLFSQAKEKKRGPDYSRVLYIAPTALKVQEAKRVFHELTGGCYVPPVMTTLPQISKRLYSLFENRKIITHALVRVILSREFQRSLGHSCLIASFIDEMKLHYPQEHIAEITKSITSVFDRRGTPEEISSRTLEALTIMERYAHILEQNAAADENDVMSACPEIIRKQNIRFDCLIVDGFLELNPSEEDLVKILVEHSSKSLISIPYDANYNLNTVSYYSFLNNNFIFEKIYREDPKPPISLAHYPYPGAEEEIEGIARTIKRLFLAGSATELENVLVVFPELSARIDMIVRVFKKYGIPFAVTGGKPLARTRPYLDLMALLEAISNDYPRLQFAQFLISHYFKALPPSFREYIPSICIEGGLTRGKTEWLRAEQFHQIHSRRHCISSRACRTLEKDFLSVFRRLDHLESIRNHAVFSDFSDAVLKLLNDFDFDDGMGQTSGRNSLIIRILNDISIIDRFCGHAPSDFNTFQEALRHCLLTSPMPDKESPGVRIMCFADACGLEPDHLFLGGLRDGDFPSKPDIDHLMPDSVRTELGLANIEKHLLLQRFQFRRLLSSAKKHYLSYSVMEGDRLFLPSSFLSWNEPLARTANGLFSKEEELIAKSTSAHCTIISDISTTNKKIIRKMFGEKSSIRVTDIDAYRSCPRKFFIERVLSLRPLEVMRFEVEALTLGTIVHEIMQELLSEPSADLASFVLHSGGKIDDLLSRRPLEDYWKRVLKDTFLSILPDIFAIEMRIAEDGFTFMAAEVPISGELPEGIRLKGKIDRIDKKFDDGGMPSKSQSKKEMGKSGSPDGSPLFELIDYKSGSTYFSGPQILSKGTNLQLVLYADLMRLEGMPVERVGIYSLKDLSLTWIPNRKDKKEGRTLEDYVTQCRRFLRESVVGMRNGDFPANPLNEQTCRNCHERPHCPYIQKAAYHS